MTQDDEAIRGYIRLRPSEFSLVSRLELFRTRIRRRLEGRLLLDYG